MLVSAARAVSLVELLVGVFILGLVSAVVTAVFANTLEHAPEASLSRLRLVHRAAAIYRFESDGRWPSSETVYDAYLGLNEEFFISPCANQPGYMDRKKGVSYMYMWTKDRNFIFDDVALIAPLFVDLDCNLSHTPDGDKPMLGLGVSVGGEAIRIKKPGDPRRWSWWLTPDNP